MLTVPSNIYRLNEKRADHGDCHPPGFRLLRLLAPRRPAPDVEPICWQSKAMRFGPQPGHQHGSRWPRNGTTRIRDSPRRSRSSIRGDAVRNPSAAVARGIAAAVGESMYDPRMFDHAGPFTRLYADTATRRRTSLVISKAELPNSPRRIHPLAEFSGPPTPWARSSWFVHLDDENDVLAAIEYVSRNPLGGRFAKSRSGRL